MLGDFADAPAQVKLIGAIGREEPSAASGHDTVIARRERRIAMWAHELDALMQRRPDLVGIRSAADLTVEAVRWSV